MPNITDIDGTIHHVHREGLFSAYVGPLGPNMPVGNPPIPKGAEKISNWATGKRSESAIAELRGKGWQVELRYDAAHGMRYGACIYPINRFSEAPRRIAIACFDGIDNLRQHMLDCGIPESEMP